MNKNVRNVESQECRRVFSAYLTLFLSVCLLPGCASILIGGGSEGAQIVAQERPVGEALDDAGILLAIKKLYAEQSFSDLLLSVDVKVNEGRVLLTGNVDNIQTQIDAVRLAWQVNSVREVMNEVEVNDKA